MTQALVAQLAVVIGEAWWRVAERPKAWAQIPAAERLTFATCADYAVRSAKAGQREPEAIAKAICAGFFQDGPQRLSYERLGRLEREAFLRVAGAVIAAGQALRAQRAGSGPAAVADQRAHAGKAA